jgi:hypothetical protein
LRFIAAGTDATMIRLLALALPGLLAACAAVPAPLAEAPRGAQSVCAFGAGDSVPLVGAAGMNLTVLVNETPLLLQVSTGLGISSLQPGTVQRLGLPRDPRRQTGFSDGETSQNALVRSLRIGGREWTGRSLGVRPVFTPGGAPPGYEGWVAADLLRETELEIDLPARRVAFHVPRDCRAGPPPWTPVASLPVELQEHGIPVVTVLVEGQPVRARLQSANNVTLLTRALATRLGVTQATGVKGRVDGTRLVPSRAPQYRLRELAAGGEVLRDVTVAVVEGSLGPQAEMALGQDWLQHRKVWLSFANRRLYLAAPGD